MEECSPEGRDSLFQNLRSPVRIRYPVKRRGVADEWVTQLLRQGDAKVFKKYSQMKLQMKLEALEKLNRHANESGKGSGTVKPNRRGFGTVLAQSRQRTGEGD